MILAYDIGTTFLKAAVVSIGGKVLASAQAPVRMVETHDPDRRECDPNTWLSGMALVTAQLGLQEKGRIRAVVVSANGPTLVPVDADGDPLDFAMTWMDRRAQEEADLMAEFSDTPLDASFYLPKAFWIMRHKPRASTSARGSSCPARSTSPTSSPATPCASSPPRCSGNSSGTRAPSRTCAWTRRSSRPSWRSGDLVGTVRSEAEETLGIPAGLPVIAGGPDFIMSIIGTAATQPGRVCDRAGTSEGINLCWSAPVHDRRLLCFPHVVQRILQRVGDDFLFGRGAGLGLPRPGHGAGGIDAPAEGRRTAPPGAGRLLFLPFLHRRAVRRLGLATCGARSSA